MSALHFLQRRQALSHLIEPLGVGGALKLSPLQVGDVGQGRPDQERRNSTVAGRHPQAIPTSGEQAVVLTPQPQPQPQFATLLVIALQQPRQNIGPSVAVRAIDKTREAAID